MPTLNVDVPECSATCWVKLYKSYHQDVFLPFFFSKKFSVPTQRLGRKSQSAPSLTVDQVLELIKVKFLHISWSQECWRQNTKYLNLLLQTAPLQEVEKAVEGLLSRSDIVDVQPLAGQLASTLVSRSLAEPMFYTSSTLVQLVHTQSLCHRSVRIRRIFIFWKLT